MKKTILTEKFGEIFSQYFSNTIPDQRCGNSDICRESNPRCRLFSYRNQYFVLLINLLILKMAGRGPGRAPGEYINLPSSAAADVDAYFEYRAYNIENWRMH